MQTATTENNKEASYTEIIIGSVIGAMAAGVIYYIDEPAAICLLGSFVGAALVRELKRFG